MRSWPARSWSPVWRQFRSPPTLGQRGERSAARYLRRKGYKIVARGSRASRARANSGELDLVAVDGRTVVFVEVKTRRSTVKGHPAEAVDADKQRRLTRLALVPILLNSVCLKSLSSPNRVSAFRMCSVSFRFARRRVLR